MCFVESGLILWYSSSDLVFVPAASCPIYKKWGRSPSVSPLSSAATDDYPGCEAGNSRENASLLLGCFHFQKAAKMLEQWLVAGIWPEALHETEMQGRKNCSFGRGELGGEELRAPGQCGKCSAQPQERAAEDGSRLQQKKIKIKKIKAPALLRACGCFLAVVGFWGLLLWDRGLRRGGGAEGWGVPAAAGADRAWSKQLLQFGFSGLGFYPLLPCWKRNCPPDNRDGGVLFCCGNKHVSLMCPENSEGKKKSCCHCFWFFHQLPANIRQYGQVVRVIPFPWLYGFCFLLWKAWFQSIIQTLEGSIQLGTRSLPLPWASARGQRQDVEADEPLPWLAAAPADSSLIPRVLLCLLLHGMKVLQPQEGAGCSVPVCTWGM